MHEISSTSADTIVHTIKDVMLRLNLTFTKFQGQCYDGAACMAGHEQGVAKQICDEEPIALYTNCYGHSLDLAVANTIKQRAVVGRTFDFVMKSQNWLRNPLVGRQL